MKGGRTCIHVVYPFFGKSQFSSGFIRMELFWTFANILKDPFGTPFGGGPHLRQDSVAGVLSKLVMGLNEPQICLRILVNNNLVEPTPTGVWKVSPCLR
jgi:hypothetical protein